MASVAHLEKAYIEPHNAEKMIKNGIRSERDVMRAVGHTQKTTTSLYYACMQRARAEDAEAGGQDAETGGESGAA